MLLGEFGTFSTKEVKGLWQILYPKTSGCSPSSSKDLHFFPNSNQELKPSARPLGHPPPGPRRDLFGLERVEHATKL